MSDLVRVLIADDSPTSRAFLSDILSAHPGIAVVGVARDGDEAIRLTAKLRPSIVVMDVVMPGMDGFEATARIMSDSPTPVMVVTSALDPKDVALALRSVEVGALAVLPKPVGGDHADARRDVAGFARKVVTLASVRVIRRHRPGGGPADRPQPPAVTDVEPRVSRRPADCQVVAIAASTGGPNAVHDLLAALPADLPVPILVVQHIADGFIEGFARWLDAGTDLMVRLASDGTRLESGTVYVAPEARHLRVDAQRRVRLDHDPAIGGFRPAATAMFESVAQVYRDAAVGVILSGLGDDGLAGLLSLHASGGTVLAQDEATCAVFGMPGVVVAAGIAHSVAPVDVLSKHILKLTSKAVT